MLARPTPGSPSRSRSPSGARCGKTHPPTFAQEAGLEPSRVRCRERPRTLIRSVRWSDDEWASVSREAARRGIRPASYIRAAALRHWPEPPRAPRTGRTRFPGRRTIRRGVRFHPGEFARVERLATTLGLPPNRFIREAAVGYQISSRADDGLIYQLAKIGNNLNQLTRLAHTTRMLDDQRFESLATELRDVLDRLL